MSYFKTEKTAGYWYGIAAYLLWGGLFPFYFKALESINAYEIVAHRIIWSALIGLILLFFYKSRTWLYDLYTHPIRLLILAITGLLISANWTVYVWAVTNEHILQASLGYYLNPLLNVVFGILILKEKLNLLQKIAVALAALSIILQIVIYGSFPYIAILLALSFSLYGLIRKMAPIEALPGLAIESALVAPIAIIFLLYFPSATTTNLAFWQTPLAGWLLSAGIITLLPLLCFNAAAKRLPYIALGFLQFLSPTLLLLTSILVFHEHFSQMQLISFSFIWLSLAVYSFDIYWRWRAKAANHQ